MTIIPLAPTAPPRQPLAGKASSHVRIGNVPVFDGTASEAADACLELIANGGGGRVATANLDFLALAETDSELSENLQRSTLVVADGMPVVWLAKLKGARKVQRTAGVDLVATICTRAGELRGLRVATYGSSIGLASAAAGYLESLSPNVYVATTICPPFRSSTPAELEQHGAEIAAAKPDLVLVAMGCPTQERLIAQWYSLAPSAVWIGVGGTFDFFASERKRAPRIFRATGSEWLVRMAQDPQRLGQRYLGRDLPALARLAPRCALDRLRGSNH